MRINEPVAYALLYASMYAAFGVASPFWPKFFETRSLASQQIGFMLGAAMLVRLLAGPPVGRLADVSKSWRLVLAICAALAAVMAVALLLANTFWLLFLVASLQAAALAPTTSIADALSVNAAKPQIAGKPFEYGWIRGAASAAFVLGTLIMGQLVSRSDFNPIIWLNAALLLATAAATALLPKPNTEISMTVELRSFEALVVQPNGTQRLFQTVDSVHKGGDLNRVLATLGAIPRSVAATYPFRSIVNANR